MILENLRIDKKINIFSCLKYIKLVCVKIVTEIDLEKFIVKTNTTIFKRFQSQTIFYEAKSLYTMIDFDKKFVFFTFGKMLFFTYCFLLNNAV